MSASFSVAGYIPHWLLAGSQSHSERHLEIVIKGYKPQVTVYVPKNNFPKSSSNKNFTTWCSELFPLIDWRTQVFLQGEKKKVSLSKMRNFAGRLSVFTSSMIKPPEGDKLKIHIN